MERLGPALAALMLSVGIARAQEMSPLVGAWTGTQANGTVGTDVYRPDGTLISTVRLGNGPLTGMLIRVAMRYQTRQVGQNQYQVNVQVLDWRPRQMCAPTANGPACQPFPQPPLPSSLVVTMLDANTIEANGVRSTRDPAPVLAQGEVPEAELVPSLAGGGGGVTGNTGLADLCTLGQTQCDISGWRKYCERWPNGQANWMYHGVRCRNGYGQPEY